MLTIGFNFPMTRSFELFQPTRTPCFELIANLFTFVIQGRYNNMAMIGATIHCVQLPVAYQAMVGNCLINQETLAVV